MVDWFHPIVLLETGFNLIISKIIGKHIDPRVLSLPMDPIKPDSDYSGKEEVYFDYAADTGDGWNPTYALALKLSTPLRLKGQNSEKYCDFVVLGGDQVYPYASEAAYKERLIQPFNQAAEDLKWDGNTRPIYVIPGNHDWYDSLVAFTHHFCGKSKLDAFETIQKRSYFALKLPHRWHLWAVDLQLSQNIDKSQLHFFTEYAKKYISSEHHVILCAAKPAVVNSRPADESVQVALGIFEEIVENRSAKVPLKIAGDVHNYQRYTRKRTPHQRSSPIEKLLALDGVLGKFFGSLLGKSRSDQTYDQIQVVSGGGGAYLHPTHAIGFDSRKADNFECAALYPAPWITRDLAWRNLFFAIQHIWMSALIGLFYLLLFWGESTDISSVSNRSSSFILDFLGHICGSNHFCSTWQH